MWRRPPRPSRSNRITSSDTLLPGTFRADDRTANQRRTLDGGSSTRRAARTRSRRSPCRSRSRVRTDESSAAAGTATSPTTIPRLMPRSSPCARPVQLVGNHRLVDCDLFATIEPCPMCAGALVHSRIRRLVYGADDPKAGAVQSVMQVLNHPQLNHKVEVRSGVLAGRSAELLQTFFKNRR